MESTSPSSPALEPVRQSFDWSWLQWGAGLVLLAGIVYWPTINNGFIWDDGAYVENNVQLRSVEGLYNIWFKLRAVPQYYPLVHSTFWAEYHLWALNPIGYHVTNLVLHAISAVLVWRLLARLAVPGAWLAAAIFAVHPVAVESVAWVTERKNVLSCALALGSLLAYLRFLPPEEPDETGAASLPRGSWGFYVLALVLYIGALLSKTVTVSVPAVLLVIYWWKRGRLTWRDAARLSPFFAVGLALAYVTVWMETTHVGAAGPEWNFSFIERTLIAGRALWFYASKLLWPYPLIFFYYRWEIDAAAWWQYLFPLAALAVPVALWLARDKIGRGPLAAVLIFGGVLFPALGFFNVYPFRFSFVADHFQYHASIALFALAAAGATLVFRRFKLEDSSSSVLAAGGVLLVLGGMTHERTHAYRNLTTLYEDTLAQNPSSWAAHYNLGDSLVEQGKFKEAIAEIREAVRLAPQHTWLRNGLASALLAAGQIEQAEAQFNEALAGSLHDLARADAHVRLGNLLVTKGQVDDAIAHYRQAIESRPGSSRALFYYALALAKKGDREGAIQKVRQAVDVSPFYPDAHHVLGAMLAEQGKITESIEHLQTAVKLNPQNAQYLEDLGGTMLRTSDPEAAEAYLREAIRLRPKSAKAHNFLGAMLAQQNRIDAAIKEFETALAIDPNHAGAARNLQRLRAGVRPATP